MPGGCCMMDFRSGQNHHALAQICHKFKSSVSDHYHMIIPVLIIILGNWCVVAKFCDSLWTSVVSIWTRAASVQVLVITPHLSTCPRPHQLTGRNSSPRRRTKLEDPHMMWVFCSWHLYCTFRRKLHERVYVVEEDKAYKKSGSMFTLGVWYVYIVLNVSEYSNPKQCLWAG